MTRYLEDLGAAPVDLGIVDLDPSEMMFWLYLPIIMPGPMETTYSIPTNLGFAQHLISECFHDASDLLGSREFTSNYIYITAKTMWVEPGQPGNRPGWHVDGFGSNGDLNYIWADMNPTEFAVQDFAGVRDDDDQSMRDMTSQIIPDQIKTYPNKTLLRLDEKVVHRVSPDPRAGVRTFIKITVSKHQFRNKGNSHNCAFEYDWALKPRGIERNLDHGSN